MNSLHPYLPQDRLRALACGETLPDRTFGSALFADISGFTPLTEALLHEFGPRRGVEELTRQINAVYDALIAEVEKLGGSVISFAGDAITCWFDEKDKGRKQKDGAGEPSPTAANGHLSAASALTAAVEMQSAMRSFPNLALKVSIVTGPARRFAVGDPTIQLLDTLAGSTISRLADAEHLAGRGEVLVDQATTGVLEHVITLGEWRAAQNGERFATVRDFHLPAILSTSPHETENLPSEILRPWLLPATFEREQCGLGVFLTELRPVTALFLRFGGIDYDADEQAGDKLNALITRVQAILARCEGALLQLNIGDKGSYGYAAFGAPVVHENDAHRALNTALELRSMAAELPFIEGVQIGVSRGVMRSGAYGGTTRRTYGVLGDEVNLAARLMQVAAPAQIIVSGRVQTATAGAFIFESLPALKVKGKNQPVTAFLLHQVAKNRNYRLLDPFYTLPMVGRQAELALIAEKMGLAMQGQGQVIGITGEAGLGKSRLAAEGIHLAHRLGFTVYGGDCRSDGVNTPYLVWRAILRGFFDVDVDAPVEQQAHCLVTALERLAPRRLLALPLVAGVLGLALPDNDFTRGLEPKDRKSALEAMLADCLCGAAEVARSEQRALLFVLEDMHWLDALSQDLLEELARASARLPVLFILAYRPPQIERPVAVGVEKLEYFTHIDLCSLTPAEAAQIIATKLSQIFPGYVGGVPELLSRRLMEKTLGNPFYLEEVLNYLHDLGFDPSDFATLEKIELPDSLHTLILSRLDQLSEHERLTIKVASIIGRRFRVAWLHGYYPALGILPQVKADLAELDRLNITPLDTPEPELAYIFKHVLTQEVTYESLPYATRAQLHEQLARYLEPTLAESLPLDLLAYHYGRSANTTKQSEYFRKAGDAAQAAFANQAALEYYGRLLPLLEETRARIEIHLKRGQVLETMGKWSEAEAEDRAALTLAGDDAGLKASAQYALGKLSRLCGEYALALEWLAQAQSTSTDLADQRGQAQALVETGLVLYRLGDYKQARQRSTEGLMLSRAVGDALNAATALNTLGSIAAGQGNYVAARAFHGKSLMLQRQMGNKPGIANSLSNLGNVAYSQSDYAAARALHEESLALRREMGNKRGMADSLNNLGLITHGQGDYATAQALYEESLALRREMGDKWGIAMSLSNLGSVIYDQGDYATARPLHEESLALRRETGDKRGTALSLNYLGGIAYDQGDYATAKARYEESLALRRDMNDKWGIAASFNSLGNVAFILGDYGVAQKLHESGLELQREIGDKWGIVWSCFNLGLVAVRQEMYTIAVARYRQSLELAYDIGDKRQVVCGLIGMADATFQLGPAAPVAIAQARRSARLVAAAEILLAAIKGKLEPYIGRYRDSTLAALHSALGEESFHAAWAEGEKMTLEEAVAYALEEKY